jgi:RecJ-like exonuclease
METGQQYGDIKMKTHKVPCSACAQAKQDDRKFCHECNGVGYIEVYEKLPNCTGQLPECPASHEPMVGGWECAHCGRSGPT